MLFTALSTVLLGFAATASPLRRQSSPNNTISTSSSLPFDPPTPPQLEFLYRAMVLCPADLLDQQVGPLGQRKAIPIVGGNVTFASGMTGSIRNLGADEGLVDPQTGIFTADTRYHAVLNDGNSTWEGTDLFFQTSGPKQQDGSLHLRIEIETASRNYYYLNNVVAMGNLNNLGRDVNNVSTLRIDAYNMRPGTFIAFSWLNPADTSLFRIADGGGVEQHGLSRSIKAPPGLNWLFTATFSIQPNLGPLTPGPYGIRLNIPIKGGQAVGPNGFAGQVLPVGADWAVVDPTTGIGIADARWSIVLPASVGTNGTEKEIFVFTEGPSLPPPKGLNGAHLSIRLQTGFGHEWSWLNFVCAVGVLDILNPENTTLQTTVVDVFHLDGEWTSTLLAQ
ncbi:hypothetical protein JCM11641_005187 [Rhodosporidiobolus odoratus]